MLPFPSTFVCLPIMFVVFLSGGILSCFCLARASGHLNMSYDQWPFLSDAGTTHPESCLFTLTLNLAAFFSLATAFVYYRYVIYNCQQSKTNIASLVVAAIGCFGIMVVGAVQTSVLPVPHMVGAGLAFISAAVYSWLIVAIDLRQKVSATAPRCRLVHFRLAITLVQTVCLVIMVAGSTLRVTISKSYHNIITMPEWILVLADIAFALTLARDLHRVTDIKCTIGVKSDPGGRDEQSSCVLRRRSSTPPKLNCRLPV